MVDGNWVKYRFIKVIARSKTNLAVSNGILTQDFSSQSKRTTYKINYENINNLMDTTNYIMLQHKDIYQYEMKNGPSFSVSSNDFGLLNLTKLGVCRVLTPNCDFSVVYHEFIAKNSFEND